MRECLPKNVFQSLKRTLDGEQPLDPATADVIANAMKDWAIAKGRHPLLPLVPADDRSHGGEA